MSKWKDLVSIVCCITVILSLHFGENWIGWLGVGVFMVTMGISGHFGYLRRLRNENGDNLESSNQN